MNEELQKQMKEQGEKIDAIYKSVNKIRKYFKILTWISILVVILPLFGLLFAIPKFLNLYSDLAF